MDKLKNNNPNGQEIQNTKGIGGESQTPNCSMLFKSGVVLGAFLTVLFIYGLFREIIDFIAEDKRGLQGFAWLGFFIAVTAVITFLTISLGIRNKQVLRFAKTVSRFLMLFSILAWITGFICEVFFNIFIEDWFSGFLVYTLIFVFYYKMIKAQQRSLNQ